jgi:aspartate/methionine/tyrosine aminotransferase
LSRLDLPAFALEVYFSKWEFAASHHLTASDAETLTIEDLLSLGSAGAGVNTRTLLDTQLGYVPTWGTDSLRNAIASTYEAVEAGDVLAFAGAGEAIFWGLQALLDSGDHAIATVPSYQSIESVPLAAGVDVDGLPLWSGTGSELEWVLDLDRLRSLLRPNTRLIAVNFPNNPTGFVPEPSTWLELLELCDERGIRLFSDEVYRGLELSPVRPLQQAADVSARALSVNVMSKAYGLPGLRVGWVASRDRRLLERLEKAKHYTSICNAAPAEFLAAHALRNAEAVLNRNRQIVDHNNRLVESFMAEHVDLFDYRRPDGGCVAFPRYRGADGVESFCRRAVEEHGVFLLPASIYASALVSEGEFPADRFRIGIGRKDLAEGLEQLRLHLRVR